jgi:hypothetical protein
MTRDTGFIEFSRSEDWWQEDALTEALRAAEPIPHTNPNPPSWAIAMVEELGRQYAATAKRRADKLKHAKAA